MSVQQKRYLCRPLSMLCPLLGQHWGKARQNLYNVCHGLWWELTCTIHSFFAPILKDLHSRCLATVQYCTLVVFTNLSVILTDCSVLKFKLGSFWILRRKLVSRTFRKHIHSLLPFSRIYTAPAAPHTVFANFCSVSYIQVWFIWILRRKGYYDCLPLWPFENTSSLLLSAKML